MITGITTHGQKVGSAINKEPKKQTPKEKQLYDVIMAYFTKPEPFKIVCWIIYPSSHFGKLNKPSYSRTLKTDEEKAKGDCQEVYQNIMNLSKAGTLDFLPWWNDKYMKMKDRGYKVSQDPHLVFTSNRAVINALQIQ